MGGKLTDPQVAQVLDLLKGSDSVELKLTVPDTDIRSTADALAMDPLDGELRQVVFFDTVALTLSRAGVVVRARRIQGGAGDTTIKLRPVNPDDLPADLRKSNSLKVELDALPGGFVCSASVKGKSSADDVRAVLLGEERLRDLFSKEQRAFYRDHAPAGLKLNDLVALGPINVVKLVFEPRGQRRRFVAELWLYPDGSRILELSTKCAPKEVFQVAAEVRQYLSRQGVDLTAEQQPKTNRALTYFAALRQRSAKGRPSH